MFCLVLFFFFRFNSVGLVRSSLVGEFLSSSPFLPFLSGKQWRRRECINGVRKYGKAKGKHHMGGLLFYLLFFFFLFEVVAPPLHISG